MLAVFDWPYAANLVVLAPLEVRIVPHDVGSPVPTRAEVDDARRRIGEQLRHEQAREQEVPDVVGTELHLEAFGGALERRVHDARVVDQQVQTRSCVSRYQLCEAAHAGERREVERARSPVTRRAPVPGSSPPRRRGEPRSRPRARRGRRPTRARVPSPGRGRSDAPVTTAILPVQVDAFQDFIGRRLEAHQTCPSGQSRVTRPRPHRDRAARGTPSHLRERHRSP